MTDASAKVALFADSFHEVNGAALTCRQLELYARRHHLPFLSLRAGAEDRITAQDTVTTIEVRRSGSSFALDPDLDFDPLFLRHRNRIRGELRRFGVQLIHITSPGDFGILGAIMSRQLRVPLIASWHTNLHEFGARRLEQLLRFLPRTWRASLGAKAERAALECLVRFYAMADVILAPNAELVAVLRARTGKPTLPMLRGVDCELFSPGQRDRRTSQLVLGYVGRLKPEKNVRFLVEIENALMKAGRTDFRFLIVGQGSERGWLEAHLRHAEFTGVLEGEDLARAYASVDVFVFPSQTDTFGNVVQEAMASGVPAVVMPQGGPRFLVETGVTGFVASDENDFIRCVLALMSNEGLRGRMGASARRRAENSSWDNVFESVYGAYDRCLRRHFSAVAAGGPELNYFQFSDRLGKFRGDRRWRGRFRLHRADPPDRQALMLMPGSPPVSSARAE